MKIAQSSILGDQTGIGYFCALWQLAAEHTPVSGFITFNDPQTAGAFSENCSWLTLQAVSGYSAMYKQTEDWAIAHQPNRQHFAFYRVGNAKLIVTLRKLLQTYGFTGNQIQSKGFWHEA